MSLKSANLPFPPHSDQQLSGWEEYFLPAAPLFYPQANQTMYSFYFPKFVILGRQRFLVSDNPELKSVNMYLGQLQ